MAHSGDAVDRHPAEARLLLNGEADTGRPPPRPSQKPEGVARRAERERELQGCLEKVDWYRREIKLLRQELDSRDHVLGGPTDPRDRDPMELQNVLAERRKELLQLQRSGEGLERLAAAQRRAEAAQNALRPEVEERLQRAKKEVEQQKRKNAKLQTDRLKLSNARKAADEELRAAGAQLKANAAQLQRPTRPAAGANAGAAAAYGGGSGDPPKLRQLRQNVDILREAVRQDERKFAAALRELAQDIESAQDHNAGMQASLAAREAQLLSLQANLQQHQASSQQPSPRIGALDFEAEAAGLMEEAASSVGAVPGA